MNTKYIHCNFTIGIALWKAAGRNTDILQLKKELSHFRTFDYSRAYILQKGFAAPSKVCIICTNYMIFADWGKVLVLPLSHVYCSPTNIIPPRPVHLIDQIRNEGQQMLCTELHPAKHALPSKMSCTLFQPRIP